MGDTDKSGLTEEGYVKQWGTNVNDNATMWAGVFGLLVVLCVVLLYCWWYAACQREESFNAGFHAAVDGGTGQRWLGVTRSSMAGDSADAETARQYEDSLRGGHGRDGFFGGREGPWFGSPASRLDAYQASASKQMVMDAAAAAEEEAPAAEGMCGAEHMAGSTEDALERSLRA